MSVWATLVGQRHVVDHLSHAVAEGRLTQAWLFTGPPGSGRSNAAIAFAAALQCEQGGCGECPSCRQVLAGSHPDVRVITTRKLSLGIDEIRDLVRAAAMTPSGNRWQIIVVEDADRLTDQANNALLKAIEEPGARTMWMLSAPTPDDMLPTIRSRCRVVSLATPTTADVEAHLVNRLGVPAETARHAAAASQGHIGRAKALATDPQARAMRDELVRIPLRLTSLGEAMTAAARALELTKETADAESAEASARATADLKTAYGVEDRGRRPREYAKAASDLEKELKTRATRAVRDKVDNLLTELLTVYRDAIALATSGGTAAVINEDLRTDLAVLVDRSTPELNLQRCDRIATAREQLLERNVPAQLVVEALFALLATERLPRPGALPNPVAA